jgi:prepilin-type N-terminal cleavage/methylation domain-containing protein
MNEPARVGSQPRGENGFSLIEAMVAMVILSFGLIAVTNLLIVSAASNSIANHSTAAATAAVEVMERLKAVDYPLLAAATGGNLAMDTTDPADRPACVDNAAGQPPPNPPVNDCVVANNFELVKPVVGLGDIWVRWTIVNPAAGGPDTLFITVRAESSAPLAARRSRAEFTAFRTCTTAGCP